MTQRCFTLNFDELLIAVHIKESFVRIDHFEHDDGGNFDRITLDIVDFQLDAVKIANPQGNFFLFENGTMSHKPLFRIVPK